LERKTMTKLTVVVVALALSAAATVAIAQSDTGFAKPAAADAAVRESMMNALKSAQVPKRESTGTPSGASVAAAKSMPAAASVKP
jgi:hypothetical protein